MRERERERERERNVCVYNTGNKSYCMSND